MKPLNSMDPSKFPKKECRSEMVCLDHNTRTTELNLFSSPIQQVFAELCAGYCVGYREVQFIDFAL